ncbi:unnamed protein product [Didymodactylos carnosus]|uniref:Dolichyl-diphosphooligosaccharide--protein glycosyltransferase subunit 1 n=1 Tax=Didymodactylos carnosus TaxID=1234261 RepID=A0A813PRM7_9BILA|nr:unnamed protein product [Didymodactylos carnosus]CAF0940006.1 unnamed protein product [Didymodactylos carnosus]CAF3537147.1 unnamed protein product [Didymodactylos carnosus]CAF3715295.1 unnamed protein product [Didymodactylos carnosus]
MINNDYLSNNLVDEQQHSLRSNGILLVERPIITQKSFNEVFIPTTYDDQTPVILFKRFKHSLRENCVPSVRCGKSYINTLFPFLSWIRRYERGWLPADILCGLTIAIMQIPQGMAYALLANLPAVLGAIAVVSLMTGNVIDRLSSVHHPIVANEIYKNNTLPILITNDPSYAITIGTTLALAVGIIQLILSICRLGFVTAFLSDAFISGYTTGTAVLVFTSQISDIFGLTIKRYVGPLNILYTYIDIFKNLKNANPTTVIISLCSITLLVLVKEFIEPFYKRQLEKIRMFRHLQIPIPIELIVIICGTVVSHIAELNSKYHVKIVQKVDSGFPSPRAPSIMLLPEVIKDAVVISIVSFAICISLATTYAKRFKYVVDGNQELLAYGLCSVVSSFFSCFPSSASLSRTSVYVKAGGKTQLASLIACFFLLMIILKIGPLFQPLPKACLASIIVVALKNLFLQAKDIWKIGRITKLESIVWILTFLSTVILDIDLGLIIGVAVSLVIVILRQFRPRTTILGQFNRSEVYKNAKRYSNVHELSNIKIFRFESCITYFNADYFRSRLLHTAGIDLTSNCRNDYKNTDTLINKTYRLTNVIVDCSSMNQIDYTGAKIFIQTIKDLNDAEFKVYLCNMRYYIYELLERLKMTETCSVFVTATIHDAVYNIKEKMSENNTQVNIICDRYSFADGISGTSTISSACMIMLLKDIIFCVLFLTVSILNYVYTEEQSGIVNTDVERSVDLVSHLPKHTTTITIENRGSKSIRTYEYYVEPQYANDVAYVGASIKRRDDDERSPLGVKTETSTDKSKGNLYLIDLGNDVQSGKTFTFEVEVVYVHALKPYPTEITQGERQLILYKMNVYYYTKYSTTTQKTIITLPTDRAESYAQLPKPVNKNDQTITYGSYENTPTYSKQEIILHYENNNPFLTISNLNRWIEISHWGNIAVEETIDMYHSGAKLKGSFSRLDFQRRQDSYSAVKTFKTSLPAAARDVYYRDEIGNISTSHVREMSDQVEVEIRPRFPLYGGWKTHYILGYNVPSYQYLFNKGNNYVLKMRLIDHVYDDQLLEQVHIKIVLPEGASNIEFYPPPYDVQRLAHEKHFTYLDTVGRPVVVVRKRNVVFNHIQDFELHYTFEKYLLLREPLLIVGVLFCLFSAVTVLVRLNFSITENEGNESRLRLQAIWDQVIDSNSNRLQLYQKFDDALNMFKTNKDIRVYNDTRKKIENELKLVNQELNAFALKAKSDSIDGSEKMAELQRIDTQIREHQQLLSGHAEKFIGNKQTKQVYMENETNIRSKIRELNARISAIINQY